MPAELLCIGDVHVGRVPARLEVAFAAEGLPLAACAPPAALRIAIDTALERRVAAVLFAGDLVDHARDLFEGFSVLQRELARLQSAGIPAYAIAGNHDVEVLPRLAARLPGALRLLGPGGVWERVEIPGTPLDLLGWSFAREEHTEDPTLRAEFAGLARARPGRLCLGLVHGELGQSNSRHAPLSEARLRASDCAAWLLGHWHRPSPLEGERPLGYLGSLVGLDPGEPELHGPVLVRTERGGVRAQRLPLAPLRWERVVLELAPDQTGDEDAIDTAVFAALREHVARDSDLEAPALRAIAFRVTLQGRIGDRRALSRYLHRYRDELRRYPGPSDCLWLVEHFDDCTRSAVDLEHLARESSPLGHLARRVAELESGGGDRELLMRAEGLAATLEQGAWPSEALPPLPPLQDALLRAARDACERLAQQRAPRRGGEA